MADAYEPLNGSEMMELSRMFARAAVNKQLNDPVLRKHLLPCRVHVASLLSELDPHGLLPSDVASFEEWGKTKVTMKKYANHGYTFKSVVKASYTDSEVTQYLSWILKTYAGKSISSQGPDLAAYLEYMDWHPKVFAKPSGYK